MHAAGRTDSRILSISVEVSRGLTGTYTAPAFHTPNNVAIRSAPFGSRTATGLPAGTPASDDAIASARAREVVAGDDLLAHEHCRAVRQLVEEAGEAHDRGTSRQAAPCHGSGSRGRPRTRSPTMFLFTSVVPPSMVLARLRSMPLISNGNESA